MTVRTLEKLFKQIDLLELLHSLGVELKNEYLYGDAFIPVMIEYTPPERQLTAGKPRDVDEQPRPVQ